jgi:hypothetical protein
LSGTGKSVEADALSNSDSPGHRDEINTISNVPGDTHEKVTDFLKIKRHKLDHGYSTSQGSKSVAPGKVEEIR